MSAFAPGWVKGRPGKSQDHLLAFLHSLEEEVYHLRVEMLSRLFADILPRLFFYPCGAVGAVRNKCIPHIGNGEQARAQGDFVAFESARVPCPIPFFMMVVRNIEGGTQILNWGKHL